METGEIGCIKERENKGREGEQREVNENKGRRDRTRGGEGEQEERKIKI